MTEWEVEPHTQNVMGEGDGDSSEDEINPPPFNLAGVRLFGLNWDSRDNEGPAWDYADDPSDPQRPLVCGPDTRVEPQQPASDSTG